MDLAAGFFAESLADSLVIRDDHDGGDVTELQRELQRREQERADAAAAAAARWRQQNPKRMEHFPSSLVFLILL